MNHTKRQTLARTGLFAAFALALLAMGGWWFQRSAPQFAECA